MSTAVFVIPGDVIGFSNNLDCGSGCYISADVVRSSLCGQVVFQNSSVQGRRIINVVSPRGNAAEVGVVNIGDKVICKVQRITTNQAIVEILCVGDSELKDPPKGTIRKEDVIARSVDVDTVIMHNCFRPGDMVWAEVLSLGDSRQYFLSTASTEFGVIGARSQCGNIMVPVNAKVLFDNLFLDGPCLFVFLVPGSLTCTCTVICRSAVCRK